MLTRIQQWLQSSKTDESKDDLEHHLQLAAAVLLLEVSSADFEKSADEQQKIISILKQLYSLSDEDVDEVVMLANETADQASSLHQFTRLINEKCTYEDKVYLIEQLWRVAFVDGSIDKYEDYVIRKISDLLYVAHKEFIQRKLKVEAEFSA